jgi:peptidylamidoglycolate lyase
MFLCTGVKSPIYGFSVPHALALAEDKQMLCVADRENGRIQCFNCHSGSFIVQFHSPEMGSRIFSVAYSPAQGIYDSDWPVVPVGA